MTPIFMLNTFPIAIQIWLVNKLTLSFGPENDGSVFPHTMINKVRNRGGGNPTWKH